MLSTRRARSSLARMMDELLVLPPMGPFNRFLARVTVIWSPVLLLSGPTSSPSATMTKSGTLQPFSPCRSCLFSKWKVLEDML